MNALPPAGWYDDPEHPGYLRYWDGAVWTDHRSPVGGTGDAHGLSDIGTWLSGVFRAIWERKLPLLIIGAVLLAVWTVVGAVLVWAVGDLVYVDGAWQGVNGGRFVVAGVAALVALLATLVVYAAAVHQLYWARFGVNHGADVSLLAAVSATPRILGWGLLLVGGMIAGSALFVILALLSPILVVLALLAAIPVAVWAWVKLSFFLVALVAPVSGQGPIKASAAVSENGRFWSVFGRLLLVSLIGSAITYVAGIPLGAAAGGNFDDIVVTDGAGEVLYFHVGDFVDELGFGGPFGMLFTSIPSAVGSVLTVAATTWLYADVNGRSTS